MGKVHIIPTHQQRGNSVHRLPNEPQSEKLRIAAYCRVSTELANSYETQVSHYKELIQKDPSWEMAGIFADDGISGTSTKKREQFNKMIAACKAGKIDLIVMASLAQQESESLSQNVKLGLQYRYQQGRFWLTIFTFWAIPRIKMAI